MNIEKSELIKVLSQLNPWWRGEAIPDLPSWHRASFQELFEWIDQPPAPRAVLLSGARQVGKTTLLLQAVNKLLKQGVPPANIFYATFDHPLIKMAGIEAALEAWREREPKVQGTEYLFLDEAQFIPDCGTWIKHQVDYIKIKNRRIIFTGSAMPLVYSGQEAGVGRWHTIKLTTLSFYEYLKLKEFLLTQDPKINFYKELGKGINDQFPSTDSRNLDCTKLTTLPPMTSLRNLFKWPPSEFHRVAELAIPYVGLFYEYLVRGGFPQTVRVDNVNQAQRLLREDIIDKILKRDMTAYFGVRRILDLEQVFLYLCLNNGGILDMLDLCGNLQIKRPTAQKYIDLLEATHLIYRLQPFGYGKDVLRAKFKIYLADAAMAPAVLLKGKSLIDNSTALGVATETAVFKHLFSRYYTEAIRFTYWRGSKNHEIDLVAEIGDRIIPFEVKYRTQHTGISELKGLLELCEKKSVKYAYVITKSLGDFGPLENTKLLDTHIMRIPAPLLCYWMGESELSQANSSDE